MRHAFTGRFIIAFNRAPAQINTRRHDQPVIRHLRPICEPDLLRRSIHRDHALMHHTHTTCGELFIAEGDAVHIPPSGENQIAIRASGKAATAFDQRNVECGKIVTRETRGGGATKATTDDDNAPSTRLGMGQARRGKGCGQRGSGEEGAAGKGHDLIPPAYCGRA